MPKGRTNEAGRIPERFDGLIETHSSNVNERTKLNVRDCDALLVFQNQTNSPGTAYTIACANEYAKPRLVVDVRQDTETCVRQVRSWMTSLPDETVLNVAGPRASEAPHIAEKVRGILDQSLDMFKNIP